MGDKNLIWALAAGGAILLLWPSRARKVAGEYDGRDLDALADMLITETSFARDPNEMAQIVFIALNRAKNHGVSLAQAVIPPGIPNWNASAKYRDRFNNARSSSRWPAARQFAQEVLDGKRGRNLGYTKFVHPTGMPTPPCASNRYVTGTFAGDRCLPSWIQRGDQIGGALFA